MSEDWSLVQDKRIFLEDFEELWQMFPDMPKIKRCSKTQFQKYVVAKGEIGYANESGDGRWGLWICPVWDNNGGFVFGDCDHQRLLDKHPYSRFLIHFSGTVEDAAATVKRFGADCREAGGKFAHLTLRGHAQKLCMSLGNPKEKSSLIAFLEGQGDVDATSELVGALKEYLQPDAVLQLDGCETGKEGFPVEKNCVCMPWCVSFKVHMTVPLLARFAGAHNPKNVWGSGIKHDGWSWHAAKFNGVGLGKICLDVLMDKDNYWQVRLQRALIFAHIHGVDGKSQLDDDVKQELLEWAQGGEFKAYQQYAQEVCHRLGLL